MNVRTFFRGIVTACFVMLIGLGLVAGTVGNLSHKSYVAALAVSIGLVVAFSNLNRRSDRLAVWKQINSGRSFIALCVFCLLLNGGWTWLFRAEQAADYRTFYQAAKELAESLPLSNHDYLAMFPHILGYATFLSLFFRVFSPGIIVAAVVNVILTTGSGVLLYFLCLRFTGKRAVAMSAFFLWSVCPSKLLYNTMTLSEPYYTFLLLLFFVFVQLLFDADARSDPESERKEYAWKATLAGLASGTILSMVNAARPIGLIPVIALLVWLLFLADSNRWKEKAPKTVLFVLVLLISYQLVGTLWKNYETRVLGQNPPSIPGYSIYVGFNPETQGSYSDEDMTLFQSRYFGEYERNAETAQQSMLESAKVRIQTTDHMLKLMFHKLGTLLGHDEGGAYYSREGFSDRTYSLWCIVSNVWYYVICILAIVGCLSGWRQNRGDSFWVLVLCVIGVILAQLLVEVAARYHYCLIPMLLLVASIGHRSPAMSENRRT